MNFSDEVKRPQNGNAQIVWHSATKVKIYLIIHPNKCPKGITLNMEAYRMLKNKK
ncbi:MAG: DUF2586 family protein [Sodalis sp. (in: enterobacteria)]